jgi:hypothetical protein
MADDYSELVSRYCATELQHHPGALPAWMYRNSDGDLCVGLGHYLASPGGQRLELENAVRSLWTFGAEPLRVNDEVTVGQLWGMQLNSRAAEISVGVPVVDRLHPEVTGDPARFLTRTDPDLLYRSSWELMADEAEEMFSLPFGRAFDETYYLESSTFRLPRATILSLLNDDARATIAEIEGSVMVEGAVMKDFQAFGSFPVDAQLAVLDLARQLGVSRLARYTSFRMAVGKQDWKSASILCPLISSSARNFHRRSALAKAAEFVAAQAKAAARSAPTTKPSANTRPGGG